MRARAAHGVLGDIDKPYLLRTDTTIFHVVATGVLDAMLDCLTEAEEEWMDAARSDPFPAEVPNITGLRRALAALREPTDG